MLHACSGDVLELPPTGAARDATLALAVRRVASGARANAGVRDGPVLALLGPCVELAMVAVRRGHEGRGHFARFSAALERACRREGAGLVVGAVGGARLRAICERRGWERVGSACAHPSYIVCRAALEGPYDPM